MVPSQATKARTTNTATILFTSPDVVPSPPRNAVVPIIPGRAPSSPSPGPSAVAPAAPSNDAASTSPHTPGAAPAPAAWQPPAGTRCVVFTNDACAGHRYIRTKDSGQHVEIPARLKSIQYARLRATPVPLLARALIRLPLP